MFKVDFLDVEDNSTVTVEVSFRHRHFDREHYINRQAVTICRIVHRTSENSLIAIEGRAYCGWSDYFSKRKGRDLSLKRALKSLVPDEAEVIKTKYLEISKFVESEEEREKRHLNNKFEGLKRQAELQEVNAIARERKNEEYK